MTNLVGVIIVGFAVLLFVATVAVALIVGVSEVEDVVEDEVGAKLVVEDEKRVVGEVVFISWCCIPVASPEISKIICNLRNLIEFK